MTKETYVNQVKIKYYIKPTSSRLQIRVKRIQRIHNSVLDSIL